MTRRVVALADAAGGVPACGEAHAAERQRRQKHRDGLVTRPGSLTSETKAESETTWTPLIPVSLDAPVPFFVDWLTISQDHHEVDLPRVDCGVVMSIDTDGAIDWRTTKALKHEGSFSTSVNIKCDGHRVTFSGNVSRFGRPDNVFGFDFRRCIDRINGILSAYGLPPFTAGQPVEFASQGARKGSGQARYGWTGARVSRIDLTRNYSAGSAEDAHAFMVWLGSQHSNRQEGRVLGQGETVAFGGGKRQYWKAYLKAPELVRHASQDQRLIDWCSSVGLVRFEGTVRSNALTDMRAAYLGDYERGIAMAQLIRLFEDKSQILSRAEKSTDDLDELPRAFRGTARDYLAGMDVQSTLPRSTFYKHRSRLLEYGIDIAVRNVTPFKPRIRVIELKPVEIPHWYQFAA